MDGHRHSRRGPPQSEARLALASGLARLAATGAISARSLVTASDATCGREMNTTFLPPSRLQGLIDQAIFYLENGSFVKNKN